MSCVYNRNTQKWDVKFNTGKTYSYAYLNVEKLSDPDVLNPNMYRISREGREFFDMRAIYVFRSTYESYWHICFGDGSERDYRRSDLHIIESCLTQSQSSNVFEYIKQIAGLSNIRNEETGEKLLSKRFDKISFVGSDVALAKYLNPSSLQGKRTGREYIPIFPFGCNNSQYKAVKNAMENQISVIQGPPGTGKTSIARSIAKATNKKYIRLSLGGVRDESEIRGHRKTYVGAMPGRIVEALKKVKVRNPLMLLDEIDKTGKDQRGDTASALLEVLDPEQNEHFTDHYLEVALNLSDVLFVATANDLSTIPRPLLDRMEIIEVSSYTENEKYHIANDYLVKKQMEANGLNDTQIHWKEDALRFLITDYTREAGVRNLERRIGQVSRKVTRDIYQKKHRKVTITKKVIKEYLGRPVYEWEKDTLRDQIGIVHGLAWTAVGGVTLKIEVNVMPGKGAVQVTGSLGNVMKESAEAAISYIRSQSRKYKIKQDFFEKHDIHIHIPEGAVPKDGPSAGITMTTAVLSAITGNKVCGNLAMTGEVTIRGDVLMIGGLKEKLLAAKRLGITKVLVPKSNEKDVKEFEEEVVEGLEIVYVKTMTQVIKEAFVH